MRNKIFINAMPLGGLTFFLIIAFIVGGIILLCSILIWGVGTASEFLSPMLKVVSEALIVLFAFLVMPLSLVKKFRSKLAFSTIAMGHVLGMTTWMLSFLYVYSIMGWVGILLAFLFKFLAPIAFICLISQNRLPDAGGLALLFVFTFIMRFYGKKWLMDAPQSRAKTTRRNNDGVIDIEARPME